MGTRTYGYWDIWVPGHMGTRTYGYWDIWVLGHMGTVQYGTYGYSDKKLYKNKADINIEPQYNTVQMKFLPF